MDPIAIFRQILNLIINTKMNMHNQYQQIKLVIVGDGSIGKTCVMLRHTEKSFNTEYVPTIFDNKTEVLVVEGIPVNLSLWDTAGQQQYSKLRSIAYPHSDIFLIAFCPVDPGSFLNAKKKWLPQIKNAVPGAKVLFIGLKSDLREVYPHSSSDKVKGKEEIEQHLWEEFKCGYMQCSALLDKGIQQIFQEAVRIVLNDRGFIADKIKNKSERSIKQQQIMNEKACYCVII